MPATVGVRAALRLTIHATTQEANNEDRKSCAQRTKARRDKAPEQASGPGSRPKGKETPRVRPGKFNPDLGTIKHQKMPRRNEAKVRGGWEGQKVNLGCASHNSRSVPFGDSNSVGKNHAHTHRNAALRWGGGRLRRLGEEIWNKNPDLSPCRRGERRHKDEA